MVNIMSQVNPQSDVDLSQFLGHQNPSDYSGSASLNGLTKAGIVTRGNSFNADLSTLMLKDGLNIRYSAIGQEEYWRLPDVIEHVQNLANAYENGDPVPPLVVKMLPEFPGKLVVIDGQHRFMALQLLSITKGKRIKPSVTYLHGDERQELALMVNSTNSKKLSYVELAEAFYRAKMLDVSNPMKNKDIAELFGVSDSHVHNVLKVYDLPVAIKLKLRSGELSLAEALDPKKAKNKQQDKEAALIRSKSRKVNNSILSVLIANAQTDEPIQVDQEGNALVKIPAELWQQLKEAQSELMLKEKQKQALLFDEDGSNQATQTSNDDFLFNS